MHSVTHYAVVRLTCEMTPVDKEASICRDLTGLLEKNKCSLSCLPAYRRGRGPKANGTRARMRMRTSGRTKAFRSIWTTLLRFHYVQID